MHTGFYPYSCALSHKHKQSSLYYFLECAAPPLPATCRALCRSVHNILSLVGSGGPPLARVWTPVEDSTESAGGTSPTQDLQQVRNFNSIFTATITCNPNKNPVWWVGSYNYSCETKEKMRPKDGAIHPFALPNHSPCCFAWLFALAG